MFRQITRLYSPSLLRSTYRAEPVTRTWTRTVISTSTTASFLKAGSTLIPFLATRYTKDHEYVKYDDSTQVGSVHITDYAQESLGDVVFVELPTQGSKVTQAGEL
jgi:hypothetical protein